MPALFFLIDLVLPLLVGIFIRQSGRGSKCFMDRMTFVGIILTLPILNSLSFWAVTLDPQFVLLPIVGFAMQVIPGVFGYGVSRCKYQSHRDRGSFLLVSMLSNRGIIGALTVFLFYGEAAYAISLLIVVFNDSFLYLIGFPIARWFSGQDDIEVSAQSEAPTPSLSSTQLPLLGFLLGVILNLAGVRRPALLSTIFEYLVHANAWLVVAPIGYALQLKAVRGYAANAWELLGIKFIMSPILVGLVAHGLGFEGGRLKVLIILASTPTAISAVFTTRVHGLNERLSVSAFALTTALYPFVALPLLYILDIFLT